MTNSLKMKLLASALILGTTAMASAQQAQDSRHPASISIAQAAAPSGSAQTPGGQPGMMGGGTGGGAMMGGGPGGGAMMGGGPGGNWGGAGHGWGMGGGMMSMMGMMGDPDQMIKFVDGRLAFIKTEMKITSAQQPLWDAFASALRENARTMNAAMSAMMTRHAGDVALPERLDQQEAVLSARLEALRKTKSALGPLYAALTDEQKKTMDTLVRGPMAGPGMM
jgi:hypothetical protein